ncbi:MAG: hypothetical protein HY981_03055 [Candidatus Magasanikbacteria bacterium]|nr:hypothetical protein [Candidatus Magasanikbacteria bacterium]
MRSLKESALEINGRILAFVNAAIIQKKPWWKQPLVFFVVAIGIVAFLSATHPAYAQEVQLTGYLNRIIAWLLEMIAGFLGKLILAVIDLLIVVSGYNNFIDADVVNTGWVLVRDVANMFYIFVMLVIAFGTMFKLEAYTWTKLLPRLIITAVVVNLSRTIMGVIIDFAQVIMITFVNGYAAAAGGNFAQGFSLDAMFKIKEGAIAVGSNTDFKIILAYLLATVMMAIALVVVSVFLAILIGRIITIWILVILAPIAFLMGTFPKGQEYYGKWWKQFQNAVIVGPVLAFFLWLSLATMSGGNSWNTISSGSALGGRELETNDLQIGAGEAGSIEKIGSFVVSIAMLMIGLQMTQELGVMGAGLAGGAASAIKSTATKVARAVAVPAAGVVATGGMGALGAWTLAGSAAAGGLANLGIAGAVKGTKKVAGYVGKSVGTKVGTRIMESPLGKIPAFFTEGARRREEELKRAMTDAQARERTRFEFKRDGFAPDYLRLTKQQRAAARAKDFGTQFEDSELAASVTGRSWLRKFKEGDLGHEGNDVHRGLTQSIFQAAYIDDMFDIDTDKMKELRDTLLHDVVVNKADGSVDEAATQKARRAKTSDNYRKLMIRGVAGDTKDVDDILWLSPEELAGKSEAEKIKIEERLGTWSNKHQDELGLLTDQKEIAKKTGHYENLGLASFNDKTKGYKVNTITEQAGLINGTLRKGDLVEKAKMNPHSIMTMLGDENNKAAGMTDLGKLTFEAWLNGMDETSLSRNLKGRTAQVMLGFAPKDEPLKKVDDKEGWVQLDKGYVDNHGEDLKDFFSNPLIIKSLFSKLTGLSIGPVGQKMGSYKFVVGDKSASLEDIIKADGDIQKALKDDSVTKGQVAYEEDQKRVEKKEMSKGDFDTKYAADAPSKPVNEETARSTVASEIEDLTSKPIESVDPALQTAVEDFRAVAESLGTDGLKTVLENVVKEMRGFKQKAEVEAILQNKASKDDPKTGVLTPEARIAHLMYTLVRQDNKKIIDALTNIHRGVKLK